MNRSAKSTVKSWILPLIATLILGLSPVPVRAQQLTGDSIPNIGFSKKLCKEYIQSGRYADEIKKVDAEAKQYITDYIESHKNSAEKLAMVLDIDETSLSNVPHILQFDYGYLSPEWDKWVVSGKAPALEGTLDLYNFALSKGISIFFITARPENQRVATTKNLEEAGYHKWTAMILRPETTEIVSSKDYKTYHRKQLTESGYHIIVNVGDQMSDLLGGYSDSVYKLPNPMYFIP